MTGPEHYSYAEELLDMAGDDELGGESERYHIAKAQVHATLAVAAATAIGSPDLPSGDWDDWRHVASAGQAGRIPGSERSAQ